MEIRKATEQDLDAIVELDRQIGQIHFEQAPEVFCPPSSRQRAFLLDAIQDLPAHVRARSWGAMPEPVSQTSMRQRAPRRRAPSRTPPSRV